MPEIRGDSWSFLGPGFDLSDKFVLQPNGDFCVDDSHYRLEDGQEADVAHENEFIRIRFYHGRWSCRRLQQMDVTLTAKIRIHQLADNPIPIVTREAEFPAASVGSPSRRPRWRFSEILFLAFILFLVLVVIYSYLPGARP